MPKSAEIIRTVVLVLEQTNTLSFAAAVDPMRAANRQAGRALFDWRFATPGASDVSLTSGLVVPGAALQRIVACDLLLVVAGFDLEAQTTPALCASLRRLARPETLVAGIDGGPWVLARAGILDQHDATTHWEDLETFATTFPEVRVRNARFVTSGQRMTSGGAAPAIEMMLDLIDRRFGARLAARVAGSFIYDGDARPARPQSRAGSRLRHSPLTARAQEVMEARLEDPLSLAALAQRLGVSPRALQMQFRSRLGCTPRAHYLSLRLAEADRLVTQTATPLQDIALRTGFASQSSFARAYGRRFGQSARARRAAFQ
ncbi:helix-turn-helix domain-containing protein [Sulfitobacter sp. D35]|uniref:GlxA family transcriptional regulator n=1 Tax=Sulfitobacter sp. D35 TaxID=3083252 RepID=UPI00296F4046|nr:helix-turn-helix domain-containing protein [Sulfitobacter sp. D35]MDW4496631.1 helix-turn-helix domain-containing protein [Sulfitobacter sp. D35]